MGNQSMYTYRSFRVFIKCIYTFLLGETRSAHDPMNRKNTVLHTRMYLHDHFDLSNAIIHAIWADQRQRHFNNAVCLLAFAGC